MMNQNDSPPPPDSLPGSQSIPDQVEISNQSSNSNIINNNNNQNNNNNENNNINSQTLTDSIITNINNNVDPSIISPPHLLHSHSSNIPLNTPEFHEITINNDQGQQQQSNNMNNNNYYRNNNNNSKKQNTNRDSDDESDTSDSSDTSDDSLHYERESNSFIHISPTRKSENGTPLHMLSPRVTSPSLSPSLSSSTIDGGNGGKKKHYDVDFGDLDYGEDGEAPTIVDYSESMVSIAFPVAVTMIIVALAIRLTQNTHNFMSISPLIQYNVTDRPESQTLVWSSIINSVIFVGVIALSTIIMVTLYYFRFMKALYGWLMATSILLLGVFGGFLFILMLTYANLALDYFTFILVVWNFSAGGMVSLFWFAPKLLNRGYLIAISSLTAIFISRMPEWTTWSILTIVALYDIFAVLVPGGPLKKLFDLAKERGEEIPAFIYNGSVTVGMAYSTPRQKKNEMNLSKSQEDSECTSSPESSATVSFTAISPTIPPVVSNTSSLSSPTTKKLSTSNESISTGVSTAVTEDEIPENKFANYQKPTGIKIGLGDMVFYSVLLGRASMYDLSTIFTCFVAILTGLFLTLLLLAVFKKALPALPISIGLGIIFYFTTSIFLSPYLEFIGMVQVFV